MFKLAIALLACLHAARAFTCPDDSHTFFHADVSTGCQVYHLCENSQLHTLNCPSGQAFNHETSACENASTVNCYETMGHHHHKRAIEEVHTIDIQEFKEKLVEAYRSIRPLLQDIVKDIAPSIYGKFAEDYMPAIRNVKQEVLPFFYEKVYPTVQKWVRYALRLSGKVIEKAYTSYQLSNSTHITIVSMSDLADEVSNDLKPVIQLGRYMSSRLMQNNQHIRAKRQVPDFLVSLVSPIVGDIARSVTQTFIGDGNSLTSKIILPVIYEMLDDPETRFNMLSLFISAKSAFTPLAWEMLSRQTYNTPQGTIIKVPREFYDNAINKFMAETKPILRKLAAKHLASILRRASNNVPILLESVDRLEAAKYHQAGVLRDSILHFVSKHSSLLKTSTPEYMNFYTLTEIMNDLRPIKMTLFQIAMQYFSQSENSFLRLIFGEGSFFQRQFVASPVYAKPRQSMLKLPVSSKPLISRRYGRSLQ